MKIFQASTNHTTTMNFQSLKTRLIDSIDAFIAAEALRNQDWHAHFHPDEPYQAETEPYAEILRDNIRAAEGFDAVFDAFLLHSSAASQRGG
ncbi:MAG: hypothetical protein EB015_21235, partial [Methylocystaceae bacterium]|nr:hypothetical protein [Methylocystaceae bacterium]